MFSQWCGAGLWILASGVQRARRDAAVVVATLRPARLAAILSAATLLVALLNNSWTASGSDPYSYVSQADLWLAGTLRTPISLARPVPWPNAIATFTPFGYMVAPDGEAIVPMTAPGLPLLMAAMKGIAGHAAAFWIAPAMGALLVWMTFALGMRIVGPGVGLAAAWLVATSPDLSPILVYTAYRVPGTVYLFDPRRPDAATWQPPPIRDPRPLCVPPAARPHGW